MNILFGNVTKVDAEPNGACSNPAFWQQTWPLYLQRAGYNTGIFGKAYHMGSDAPCGFAGNGYGPANSTVATNTTPLFMLPGWDRHFVYCYPLDQYFWNRYNDQGTLVGTRDAPEDYATALLGNKWAHSSTRFPARSWRVACWLWLRALIPGAAAGRWRGCAKTQSQPPSGASPSSLVSPATVCHHAVSLTPNHHYCRRADPPAARPHDSSTMVQRELAR